MLYENDYARIWIAGGILFFAFKPADDLDIHAARSVVELRLKLQGDISYPLLCDITQVRSSQKEARDYFATEGSVMIRALAYLVDNIQTTAMIRMFLRIYEFTYPTGVFIDRSQALAFLEEHRN